MCLGHRLFARTGQALAYVYFEEEPGQVIGAEATDQRRGKEDTNFAKLPGALAEGLGHRRQSRQDPEAALNRQPHDLIDA